jgi:DNA replication and repair protein RecF
MPRILRLTLTGYRNLRDVMLEIPAEGMALIGRNAQGKSNLLEAVYYLETLRSFRNARDEQLVRFGDDHFRIAAELVGNPGDSSTTRAAPPPLTIATAFRSSTKEKRITIDGEIVPRLGNAIGQVGAVLFAPDDLRLVSGPPAERRRFLDILLSLNHPGYLESLQRFRQALHRRNATLRKGGTPPEVAAWDEILLTSGAEVTVARTLWVRSHTPAFRDYTLEISGTETMRMRYDANIPGVSSTEVPERTVPVSSGEAGAASGGKNGGASTEALASLSREALGRMRDQERRLRTTLVGPHRDDLSLIFRGEEGERDLREFGSGGQRRTAALALRLLEATTIKGNRGKEPILLLDDIFAELDEDRSRRILRLLDSLVAGQVILTAPKESDIRFREATLPRWSIENGAIAR